MAFPAPMPGNAPPYGSPYADTPQGPNPFESITDQTGSDALTPDTLMQNLARMPPPAQTAVMAAIGAHPMISSAFLALLGPAFGPFIQQAMQAMAQLQGGGIGGPPGMGGPPPGMGGAPGMPPAPGGPAGMPPMGGPQEAMEGEPPHGMPPGAGPAPAEEMEGEEPHGPGGMLGAPGMPPAPGSPPNLPKRRPPPGQ